MNEEILIRFLTHGCTPEEIKEVDQWIAADRANADWLFEMERVWGLKQQLRFSEKQKVEQAYARFMSRLQGKNLEINTVRKRPAYLSWMKYAAAVVLVGLLSTNLYFLLSEKPATVNVVEVPNGQRAFLTLSDGTKIWLNSHSKLTYPAQFSAKRRDVKLEGEGFFEVARNEKVPFIVHADLLQVKVLGTKFNARVYGEEPSSITLSEGKVEVATNDNEHKVTLRPNEQVTYSKENGLTIQKSVNASLAQSWTIGETAYVNKQLIDIVSDLERRFNMRITVDDRELATEVFNCRFKETATIREVLALLKETRKLDYQVSGDQIRIFKPSN